MKTIEEALQWLQDEHNAEFASKYGEPGYQDPEKGILLANWNNVPSNMQKWLENAGYSLEWSDEWTVDYNNDKAYRTSPDSYSWEPQWGMGEGESGPASSIQVATSGSGEGSAMHEVRARVEVTATTLHARWSFMNALPAAVRTGSKTDLGSS